MSETRETCDREIISRAICREQCAMYGEPPCFEVAPEDWPNPHCDEPGCHGLADAVLAALRKARGE